MHSNHMAIRGFDKKTTDISQSLEILVKLVSRYWVGAKLKSTYNMESDGNKIEEFVSTIKLDILSFKSTLHLGLPKFVCLVFGPKSSGKSALINRLMGVQTPSVSDNSIDDDPISNTGFSTGVCEELYFIEVPDLTCFADYTKNFITTYKIKTILAKAEAVKMLLIMDYDSILATENSRLNYLRHTSELLEAYIDQSFDLGMVVTKVDNKLDSTTVSKRIYKVLKKSLYRTEFTHTPNKFIVTLMNKTHIKKSLGFNVSSQVCVYRSDDYPEKQKKDLDKIVKLIECLKLLPNNPLPFAVALTGPMKPFELKEFLKGQICSIVQTILTDYFNGKIENFESVSFLNEFLINEFEAIKAMIDNPTMPDEDVNTYLLKLCSETPRTPEFIENFEFCNEILDFLNGRDYHSKLISFINYWFIEYKLIENWIALTIFLICLDEELATYPLLKLRDHWVDIEAELDQENYGVVITKDTFELFLRQMNKIESIKSMNVTQYELNETFFKYLNQVLASNYRSLLDISMQSTVHQMKKKENIVVVFGCKNSGKTNLIMSLTQQKHSTARRFRTNIPVLYTFKGVTYLDVPGVYDTMSGYFLVDVLERLSVLLKHAKRVKFLMVVDNALTCIEKVVMLTINFITTLDKFEGAIGLMVNNVEFSKNADEHLQKLTYNYDSTDQELTANLTSMLEQRKAQFQESRESDQSMQKINANRKAVKLLTNLMASKIKRKSYFLLPFDPYSIFEYGLVENNQDRLCEMLEHLEYVETMDGDFTFDLNKILAYE